MTKSDFSYYFFGFCAGYVGAYFMMQKKIEQAEERSRKIVRRFEEQLDRDKEKEKIAQKSG